jgi:hypothetical protein
MLLPVLWLIPSQIKSPFSKRCSDEENAAEVLAKAGASASAEG